MGSVLLLPLELDVVGVDPPMSMPELRASLPFPPDTLPVSPWGANLLCSVGVLPWYTIAGSLRVLYGTFSGFGVPNRRCVTGASSLPSAVWFGSAIFAGVLPLGAVHPCPPLKSVVVVLVVPVLARAPCNLAGLLPSRCPR